MTLPRISYVGNIYPDAVCMDCGRVCEIVEEVDTQIGTPDCLEQWCYCKACNVETFHPADAMQIQVEAMYIYRTTATDQKVSDEITGPLHKAIDLGHTLAEERAESVRLLLIGQTGIELPVLTIHPGGREEVA